MYTNNKSFMNLVFYAELLAIGLFITFVVYILIGRVIPTVTLYEPIDLVIAIVCGGIVMLAFWQTMKHLGYPNARVDDNSETESYKKYIKPMAPK
ncbi:hypothetical protein [Fangia hongkongensis]|uniref:hypothetical protein n=1 Tax=Fangia hongkongensis TaxID=270495 RepID=UPI00039C31C6|nr:hypothetical protein [Fangia hongkongensis]MBK2125470.1 hypothetical protein [Fangia hongkongensis]